MWLSKILNAMSQHLIMVHKTVNIRVNVETWLHITNDAKSQHYGCTDQSTQRVNIETWLHKRDSREAQQIKIAARQRTLRVKSRTLIPDQLNEARGKQTHNFLKMRETPETYQPQTGM